MIFDHLLFKSINSLAGRYIILDGLAIFFAEYLIFGLVLFLLYFFYKHAIASSSLEGVRKSSRNDIIKQLLLPFTSVFLVLLINRLISLVRFRVRPFITHPEIYQLVEPLADKSFPSDHTAAAFALGMSLWFFNKKWGKWALFMAALIGLARIFCGVHYPMDVLVGMMIGCSLTVVVNYVFQKIK